MHPDIPLAPYQVVGLVNSTHSEGDALFMEQGTGKTPVQSVCSTSTSTPSRFRTCSTTQTGGFSDAGFNVVSSFLESDQARFVREVEAVEL